MLKAQALLHAYTQFVINTGSDVWKTVFQASNELLMTSINRPAIYPLIGCLCYKRGFVKRINKQIAMAK